MDPQEDESRDRVGGTSGPVSPSTSPPPRPSPISTAAAGAKSSKGSLTGSGTVYSPGSRNIMFGAETKGGPGPAGLLAATAAVQSPTAGASKDSLSPSTRSAAQLASAGSGLNLPTARTVGSAGSRNSLVPPAPAPAASSGMVKSPSGVRFDGAAVEASKKKKKVSVKPADIIFPPSQKLGLRFWFTATVLVLSVLSSVAMWGVTRSPGELELAALVQVASDWRLTQMQDEVQQILLGARGLVQQHLARWTAGDVTTLAEARRDLLAQLPATRDVWSCSVTLDESMAGLYDIQRENGGRLVASLAIRNGVRTEAFIDAAGNTVTPISQVTGYYLSGQAWWQAIQGSLAATRAYAAAASGGATSPVAVWDMITVASQVDWLVLVAHMALPFNGTVPSDAPPDAKNITVHAAVNFDGLTAALNLALADGATAYLIDATSLDLIASSTGVALPASAKAANLRMPLAKLATASADAVLAGVAAAVVRTPSKAPLTDGAAWPVASSAGGVYYARVRALFNSTASTAAAGQWTPPSATALKTLPAFGLNVAGLPLTWMLVLVEPESVVAGPISQMRGSLFLLFALTWGVLLAVAGMVSFPVARKLNRVALTALALAAGVNPDVELLASSAARQPRENRDLMAAVAVLVTRPSFREFFFKWRKRRLGGA
ncbi:hypothetical protein H9P43_009975 [Blastocladiella emersonii ATCC 22665]|nr:hypothetical protein H9P43_009975 [Blastocladiella emersonii ATCC 22665]